MARETDPYSWLAPSLATIRRAHWYRSVTPITARPGPEVALAGRAVVNFASNDYLGLAGDERLATAAIAAIHAYGTGSTGSRLLSGERPLHRQLELAIARLKQTEAAMVFSSGYLANLGAIAAIVGPRDLILADQYNHSSLKTGARLSGAAVIDYPHGDIRALLALMGTERHRYRRCLVVTDSVFSMDGDCCPLAEILDAADRFGAMVLVDEAHGTGVLGPQGGGWVEQSGCTGRSLIQVGTLSKALGSLGGYVAGSAPLIEFLRNRAASWIYTTGLSPADTAAALQAIEIVQSEPERRQRLWDNIRYLQQQLQSPRTDPITASWPLLPSQSTILCLEVGRAARVTALGEQLQQRGVFVSAVRPPTAPTSRLRMTVMATHSRDQLDHLVAALQAIRLAFPEPPDA